MDKLYTGPVPDYSDLDDGIESMGFGDNANKGTKRSLSFHGGDSETNIRKSLSYGDMVVQRSISFNGKPNTAMITKQDDLLSTHVSSKSMGKDESCARSLGNIHEEDPKLLALNIGNPEDEAALKLQKVYKSFRIRRKLADSAVRAKQNWWKLLDFAELYVSTPDTAPSTWPRAITKAAKLGKGLSDGGDAQMLALQHWLEAIDPRHRYGYNLQFYFVKWIQSRSKENFFYWLDLGEGKLVNLEGCKRKLLQEQCIKYLGPMERKAYEVTFKNGKLFYLENGELLDTALEPKAKWIFVFSPSKNLYIGKKIRGRFHHSSFLAGGAAASAGNLVVHNGILKKVSRHSGHYKPTKESFQVFISYLKENNVNLTEVKIDPVNEDECPQSKIRCGDQLITGFSENISDAENVGESKAAEGLVKVADCPEKSDSGQFHGFFRNSTDQRELKEDKLLTEMQCEKPVLGKIIGNGGEDERLVKETLGSGCQHMETGISDNNNHEGTTGETIHLDSILEEIDSSEDVNSYSLGKHLSGKWASGAGARIGCVLECPVELQAMALEQLSK